VALRLGWRDGLLLAPEALPAGASRPDRLALPAFCEPHAHLDKAYTWSEHPNLAGTMAEALAANGREHAVRSRAQVRERATRALQRGWRQGLRAVRSHIDSVGPGAALSWEVLQDLRDAWADRLTLQLVALAPLSHWATPDGEALAGRVARCGGLLGGVLGPPFAEDPGRGGGLTALLRLAEEHGLAVDLHVDEADRAPGRGLRALIERLERRPLSAPLTCSHASSMGLMAPRACARLAERLAAAGVSVVALPLTNAWLLGRRPGVTPVVRPLAPIRQLQEAGVTVAVGADNVQDPWFPGGDFDPLELLRFAAIAAQQAPWTRLGLAVFTTAPARVMGLGWDGVLRPGAPADLVLLEAGGWSDVLAAPPRRRVLRQGRWLTADPATPHA
jgi:cytosine deaminase